ncbi:MAG: cytochrome c [Rhodospirillaceae bacterium]
MGATLRYLAGAVFFGGIALTVVGLSGPMGGPSKNIASQLDEDSRAALLDRMATHLLGVEKVLEALNRQDYGTAALMAETHLRPRELTPLEADGAWFSRTESSRSDALQMVSTQAGSPRLQADIDQFVAALDRFTATSEAADEVAQAGGTIPHQAVMNAFQDLTGACRACHDDFRLR